MRIPEVYVVLGEESGEIVKCQGLELCVLDAVLENANDMNEYSVDMRKKFFVITSQLGPPGIDIRPEREGDEVIQLACELWVSVRGPGEERGQIVQRVRRQQQTTCERLGLGFCRR